MNSKFFKKLISLALIIVGGALAVLFLALNYSGIDIKAVSVFNLSGFAWSSNIGWISFNSNNTSAPVNYGVHICTKDDPLPECSGKQEGEIVGYAWSPNIGWIRFDPPGPYPSDPQHSARLNLDTKKIEGWARACSPAQDPINCSGPADPNAGGWTGWIKLSGTAQDGSSYGVYIDDSKDPAELKGFAWGGEVVGWISFNCENPETGDVCSTSNYKVATTFQFCTPGVSDLQVDYLGPDNYCSQVPGLATITFSWKYIGCQGSSATSNQSKFEFQIDDNPDFSSPEVYRAFCNLNNPDGSQNNQQASVVINPSGGQSYCDGVISSPDKLSYNKRYYWRVRVWNDKGKVSDWFEGPSFTTDLQPWPYPFFEAEFGVSPSEPLAGEVIKFKDKSICFNSSLQQVPCASAGFSYLWDFDDGTTSTTKGDVTHVYQKRGVYNPSLTITDVQGRQCTSSVELDLRTAIPQIREIAPY